MLRAVIDAVRADLASVTRSQHSAVEAATHDEARAEDDKDTRGLEQSYLARGLAKRVQELKATLAELLSLPTRTYLEDDAIGLGALVLVEDEEGDERAYLVAPSGGGMTVAVEGREVRVLTPHSPLGTALIGRRSGDDVEVRTPAGKKQMVISSVR